MRKLHIMNQNRKPLRIFQRTLIKRFHSENFGGRKLGKSSIGINDPK